MDAHVLTCAILAFTRKHLNIKFVWTDEMVKLTGCTLDRLKPTLAFIERKYKESFPDHAKAQEKCVGNRQRLDALPQLGQKSEDKSSCKALTNKVTASATTYPTSNHISSEASAENRYYALEQFESTLKKEAQQVDRRKSFNSE